MHNNLDKYISKKDTSALAFNFALANSRQRKFLSTSRRNSPLGDGGFFSPFCQKQVNLRPYGIE
jgi:hypothetical protein